MQHGREGEEEEAALAASHSSTSSSRGQYLPQYQGDESTPVFSGHRRDESNERDDLNEREEADPAGNAHLNYWVHYVRKIPAHLRRGMKDPDNLMVLVFLAMCLGLYFFCGLFVWHDFGWKAWYTLGVVALTFGLLIRNYFDTSISMMFALMMLLSADVLSPRQAIAGFAEPGVFTLCILFIVAAGIAHTGSLQLLTKYVLRKPASVMGALSRMTVPLALCSAFISNTALTTMMIPVVEKWCAITRMSPSKLMMPLSFATILGGTFTIIGTSSNLVVVSLAQNREPSLSFPFFEISIVGGPIMVVGVLYLIFAAPFLLPSRKSVAVDFSEDPRRFLVTAMVSKHSPWIEHTLDDAGWRNLEGLTLVEYSRNGDVMPLDGNNQVIHILGGDFLLFSGDVTKVAALWQQNGLVPTDHESSLVLRVPNRIIVEATVMPHAAITAGPINEMKIRETYRAAILSVYRNGAPLAGRIGDIVLEGGDVLLMVVKPTFIEKNFASPNTRLADFCMITQVGETPLVHSWAKMIIPPVAAAVMVILNAAEVKGLLNLALFAATVVILCRCITWEQIKHAVNAPLYFTIAGSFAMAQALEITGVADQLASNLLSLTEWAGDWGVIYGLYLATAILTALLTNNSSAAIMVPIAFGIIDKGSVIPIKALLYTVMVATSADFATPVGYQTNLMVWGPGGYKFLDFVWVGMPLQFILSVISVTVVWLNWVYLD